MFVRGQDFSNELHVIRLLHADKDDRKIAGDAEPPQTVLRESVLRQGLSVGPEGCVGEEDTGTEPLGELGLLDRDSEMSQ